MVQSPAASKVTLLPDTVQYDVLFDENVTGRLEVAYAFKVGPGRP
jgi:hypothetical protein